MSARRVPGARDAPPAIAPMVPDVTAAFLTTKGLSKSFGETRALRDVSIEFMPGRIHTILGENGSGKSTLAKTLAGIIPPDSGEIRVEGKAVAASTPAAMLELGVAMVLQEVLVVPNRSVLDNILLGQDGLLRFARSRTQKVSLATDLLAELTSRKLDLDAPAGDLPLHEQQILVIARGFARRPRLLVLDEVTAALDLSDRETLFAAIRRFAGDGGSVAFVSHRMPEIMELSDIVHIMHNGFNTANLQGPDINPATLLAHLTQQGVDA